jgi:hypothetical protein
VAEVGDGVVYLALPLRNVGSGIGVLQSWSVRVGQQYARTDHSPEEEFRALTRDLYIPAGDIGLWQGALRDGSEPLHGEIAAAVRNRQPVTVELLYTDQAGGQRTISRFGLIPSGEDTWLTSVTRHWYLDGGGAR